MKAICWKCQKEAWVLVRVYVRLENSAGEVRYDGVLWCTECIVQRGGKNGS